TRRFSRTFLLRRDAQEINPRTVSWLVQRSLLVGKRAEDMAVGGDLAAAADGVGGMHLCARGIIVPGAAVILADQADQPPFAGVFADAVKGRTRLAQVTGKESVQIQNG